MKSTGQNSDKPSYRIILLLIVGLTAFSSAMKELNQVQQLSLDASRLIAQVSGKIVPAQVPTVPTTPIPVVVQKTESCEMQQSEPSVELPWTHVARAETNEMEETEAPVIVKRSKRERRSTVDPVQFEVRISPDHGDEGETVELTVPEFPVTSFTAAPFKFKTRKHNPIRISTRDREMLLKTLNRSISLRSAS